MRENLNFMKRYNGKRNSTKRHNKRYDIRALDESSKSNGYFFKTLDVKNLMRHSHCEQTKADL